MKILKDLVQGTKEWLKERAGKISGTKLWDVMGTPVAQLTLMYELISETISPIEETFKTAAMQRWNDLEWPAIARFEEETGKKVEEVWLIIRNDWHILSPDGIILNEDTWLYTEAIEVKCLGAKVMLRYMGCKTFSDIFKVKHKDAKKYYWQVVNYFLVMEDLEELTFYMYNPDIYEYENQVFQLTVTREELQADIAKAETQLLVFKAGWDVLKDSLNLATPKVNKDPF